MKNEECIQNFISNSTQQCFDFEYSILLVIGIPLTSLALYFHALPACSQRKKKGAKLENARCFIDIPKNVQSRFIRETLGLRFGNCVWVFIPVGGTAESIYLEAIGYGSI